LRIVKETPFEFGFLHWQVRPPEGALMVFLKGTFDLVHDGVCTITAEQALISGPLHWDDDPEQTLRLDSDFAILKPRAECHFVGHAHAPGGEPAGSALVGFRVGAVTRNLAVFGDRTFDGYGAVSAPTPFRRMPIRWELAFGGPGFARNPVGRGLAAVDTEQGRRVPLPNLEDSAELITSASDRPRPACFAPVPPAWVERTRKAGTYDQRWLKTRWPWLPEDFDYGYYLSAPPSQHIEGYWRGDEAVGLQNLTASQTILRSRLPGLRGRCFAEVRRGGAVEFVEVPLRLDTITLDGDAEQCRCVWRGLLEGVGEKMAEVETFFFIHESIDVGYPLSHYQQWLERKKQEGVDEEAELEAVAPPADDEPALPPPPPPTPAQLFANLAQTMTLEGPGPGVDAAAHAAMVAQVAALADAPEDPPMPQPSAVRAGMDAQGLEVSAELRALPDDEPEEAEAEEQEEVPGLTRADVLRHRAYGLPLMGADLTGVDLSELDLTGQDFTGAILTRADLRGCVLREAVFKEAVLDHADLTEGDFVGASFEGADLTGAAAVRVNAEGANFEGATAEESAWTGSRFFKANLKGAEFVGCMLKACDFRESVCDAADFSRSHGEQCHFEGASLVAATFEAAHFARAVFDDAVMTNLRADEGADFSECSFKRIKGEEAHFEQANLRGAQFGEAVLDKAEFARATLERANLTAASLKGARFHEANLTGAVMLKVDAMEASFEAAVLVEADLRGANLTSAQLWRARTDRAQWELALLHRTILDPANQG
jgi:uncharacterized protein YjbI with pentapeptide repeats